MLLVLTGDVQIGKTTWLLETVGRLEKAGVRAEGVVAPGVWRPVAAGDPAFGRASEALGGATARGQGVRQEVRYDKLGIDNLLLPGGERVPFARREDLARAEGRYDAGSQAARAGLAWHIDDRAIDRVNGHFDLLARRAACDARPCVLVVDELGRLELMRGEGLTSAMSLLARGPQGRYRHAVVVARDMFGLNDRVEGLFAEAWGGSARIAPGPEAWDAWFAPLIG